MTNQTNISFQNDGSPYSHQFNDIYFDTNQGTSQSECVFIDGNNISARLAKHPEDFVIAETGFGTGLNFLLTLAVFHRLKQCQNQHDTGNSTTSKLVSKSIHYQKYS